MSVNCIRCGSGKRDGIDLLCTACRLVDRGENIRREQMERDCGIIERFGANYPEDIFPPQGTSSDSIAAWMARHVCKMLVEEIRKAAENG